MYAELIWEKKTCKANTGSTFTLLPRRVERRGPPGPLGYFVAGSDARSHAVAEIRALLIRRLVDRAAREAVAGEPTCAAERAVLALCVEALARALKDVRVDGRVVRVQAGVHGLGQVPAAERRGPAERVDAAGGRAVDVVEPAALVEVAATAEAVGAPEALSAVAHAANGLVVVDVRVAAAATAAVVVHLLPLQLVLDTLAIGRIADERQNGTNALDKKGTLLGIRVIECSLWNSGSERTYSSH